MGEYTDNVTHNAADDEVFAKITDKTAADLIDLWAKVTERSRRQLGPEPIKRSVDEESLSIEPYLAKEARTARDLAVQAAPGVEYQYDGAKTTAIMAAVFYDKLIQAPWDEWEKSEQLLQDLRTDLETALKIITDYFLKVVDPAPMVPDNLEFWLRRQSLATPSTSQPAQNQSLPANDPNLPFIVFKDSAESDENFSLERLDVYWLGLGLSSILENLRHIRDEGSRYIFWDDVRVQFTLRDPYILLCDGILQGTDWVNPILKRIAPKRDKAKPVLIILADGVAEDVDFPDEGFYSVVLPAPQDESFYLYTDDQPIRLQFESMAQAFDTQIAHLWNDPLHPETEPDWEVIAKKLGRCRVAQIDRRRTVVVPSYNIIKKITSPELGWQARTLHALVLPPNSRESLREAEALMRSRIEAEQGVVAGAGAAFYWAASLLESTAPQAKQPRLNPVAWLQEALQAPMLQLLENAGIASESQEMNEIVEWITRIDGPWRTFLIDTDRNWVDHILKERPYSEQKFQVIDIDIDHEMPIILGNAYELGLVTPIPQICRVVQQAVWSAWEMAMIELGRRDEGSMEG